MDFEPCFEVHNLVSVQPKRIKLGRTTILNVIFHVMVSIYRFYYLKFKLAAVPCATPKWPITRGPKGNKFSESFRNEARSESRRDMSKENKTEKGHNIVRSNWAPLDPVII